MNFIGCIPRFLKAHAGWILTGLGSVGLIGTAILTAKETPKAEAAVLEAENEKQSEFWTGDYADDSVIRVVDEKDVYLTFWEKTKVAFPYYIPAILMGAGTLACFWGSQMFNARRQAELIAAYGALTVQFDQYREAIRAEHGEEADRKALEVSRMETKRLREEVARLKKENGPFLYGIATLPGVIFEAKPVDIQEAMSHFNRNLVLGGENNLDELYRFIGIPESVYNADDAEDYGWNQYEDEVDWGIAYVDFGLETVISKSGKMVHIISPSVPPYKIAGWQDGVSSCDRIYEGYNPDRAKKLAESVVDDCGLTKIDHVKICAYNEYCVGEF